MSIIQISKIQHRSGNLVDLPQLDEAELGFATDDKRLFIGKDSPTENIEVLTSYSTIAFNQLDGGLGNLLIDPLTAADGQVLAYDGNNWVNKGGDAGGLITLGDVSNVRIDGGGIGYVLETDGTGTLSWTPKGAIVSYILNATQANPCVITTTEDSFFAEAAEVTITNVPGMTQLNGNTFYVDVLTSNTFALYSDLALTTPIDSTGYGAFPYTAASDANSVGNLVTVTDSTIFSSSQPIVFIGDTSVSTIIANTVYYVKTKPDSTHITISETAGGAEKALVTATLSSQVYVPGGRVLSAVGSGSSTGAAAGATNSVQYNNGGLLAGGSDLTFNFSSTPKLLAINGDANCANIGSNGVVRSTRFLSNIATGTAPLQVVSTTRVANLNVSYSNVSDYIGVTNVTASGNQFPIFVSASTSANRNVRTSANFAMNPGTGDFFSSNTVSANYLSGTLTTAAQPNITSVGVLTSLIISGNTTTGNLLANSGTVYANVFYGNNLTTGANTNPGTITGNWQLSTGSILVSTYGDLAEYYAADAVYEPGTVLEFGGKQEVTIGSEDSIKVAGVVTTNAAYLMNQNCPGDFPTAIALQGRVPCFVIGNIAKGDLLVSAGNGYAKACSEPKLGSIIGKAIQNFSGNSGVIEVAIGRL